MIRSLLTSALLVMGVATFSQTPYFQAVFVKDIDVSIAWYSNVFELRQYNRVDSEERGFKQANLHNEAMLIELVELTEMISPTDALKSFPQNARITGSYKFGYAVDDINAFHSKLEKMGVEFYGNTVKDVVSGKPTFLIKDPDGNTLQFFQK